MREGDQKDSFLGVLRGGGKVGYRRRDHLGDFEVVVLEGAEDEGVDGGRGGGRGGCGGGLRLGGWF